MMLALRQKGLFDFLYVITLYSLLEFRRKTRHELRVPYIPMNKLQTH